MRLTRGEIILVVSILFALVLGAVVKQYRTQQREAVAASPARAKDDRAGTAR